MSVYNTMTVEEAKDYMNSHPDYFLEKAKRTGYICPLCKSGAGAKGTGITANPKDKIHYTCWSCHKIENSTVIDIIGKVQGLSDNKEIFKAACDVYGITLGDNAQMKPSKTHTEPKKIETPKIIERKKYDFSDIVEKAHAELLNNADAIKHFTDRGIDLDTIKKYKLGYCEEGYNSFFKEYPEFQSNSFKQGLYKYFFPCIDAEGKYTYIQAEICDREQIDGYNPKYKNMKNAEGQMPLRYFNERYLLQETTEEQIIFICEGIYDTISTEIAGQQAICTMGTGHNHLLDLIDDNGVKAIFIIGADNDEPGIKAAETLRAEFIRKNIHSMIAPSPIGKDYNDALREDRDTFISFIEDLGSKADDIIHVAEKEYREQSAAYRLQALDDVIQKTSQEKAISTGFIELDNIIDDGIRTGFYILGAVSSLGKTTFAIQLMDNFAKQGADVLFYSLEMPAAEIMAKSLSRESYDTSLSITGDIKAAKSTLGILNGRRVKSYTEEEKRAVNSAREIYKGYADHIHIIEGVGNIGIKEIEEDITKHILITNRVPIVIIDYLQILSPYEKSFSDKAVVDKNTLELKRLSRTVPIIAISSFNRESYLSPVSLTSFKESGSVEYSADVLIALQYAGMDFELVTKTDKATGKECKARESKDKHDERVLQILREQEKIGKEGGEQTLQLKVLKNRNGIRDDMKLYFRPIFNYFRGIGTDTPTENPFIKQAVTQYSR